MEDHYFTHEELTTLLKNKGYIPQINEVTWHDGNGMRWAPPREENGPFEMWMCYFFNSETCTGAVLQEYAFKAYKPTRIEITATMKNTKIARERGSLISKLTNNHQCIWNNKVFYAEWEHPLTIFRFTENMDENSFYKMVMNQQGQYNFSLQKLGTSTEDTIIIEEHTE